MTQRTFVRHKTIQGDRWYRPRRQVATGGSSVNSGRPVEDVAPRNPLGWPQVRDTQVTLWEVYRAMALDRLNDEEILKKFPDLQPADLAGTREYVANIIRTRTHDDITGRPILPRGQLRNGVYYKGRCRNATIARWNGECFYHWREKFGRIFVETIKYPTDETEPWWDVFAVIEELSNPKVDIPFDTGATFTGNRDDLDEYAAEMWSRFSVSRP